jgi:hypothetical protein
MRARTLILIAALILGGVGADWWMDEMTDSAQADVTKQDGGDPPPSPHP